MPKLLLLIALSLFAAGSPSTSGLQASALEVASTRGQMRWDAEVLRQKPEWYRSASARALARLVMLHQRPNGGWPKNIDMSVPPAPAALDRHATPDATIDNGATTTQVRFLAQVVHATGETEYRAAFNRGVDYLLAAQYPNGGWPQYFPLRRGYYSRITFNDDAVVNVLMVLRAIEAGTAPYTFVDMERRTRAEIAVTRGIELILLTQITQNGKATAWCAQHDEKTLEPAWGREYEPPSLSGRESVGIVRFLMGITRPSREVVTSIEGAIEWFRRVAIYGQRIERFVDADGQADQRVLPDPVAGPLWARFYELGTARPIFVGRGWLVRYALRDIEQERRGGYAYYGGWPARLLAEEYPQWARNTRDRELEAPVEGVRPSGLRYRSDAR